MTHLSVGDRHSERRQCIHSTGYRVDIHGAPLPNHLPNHTATVGTCHAHARLAFRAFEGAGKAEQISKNNRWTFVASVGAPTEFVFLCGFRVCGLRFRVWGGQGVVHTYDTAYTSLSFPALLFDWLITLTVFDYIVLDKSKSGVYVHAYDLGFRV